MTEQTCNCGSPTRDAAYVCENCLGELAKKLGEVPWTVEQLEITLTKTRGIDYTTLGGAAGASVPLPLDARAFEASTALRQALVMWVRFCDEEQIRHQSPMVGLPADDLVAMSRWLLWRIDGLGLSDMGWDAVSEITRAVGRCRMVIDRPAEKQYAGPCECGRDLYAKPKAKLTKCRSCEREYGVDEMREWMRKGTEGLLVTARDGSSYLGLLQLPTAQKTIDNWHAKKRVVDHGTIGKPPKLLYLMDDLIKLAAEHGGRMSA